MSEELKSKKKLVVILAVVVAVLAVGASVHFLTVTETSEETNSNQLFEDALEREMKHERKF